MKPATVGGDTVLEVTGLSKYFGGLKAVDGVDIAVKRGGVHALIGPNGSGKTTTLNVLSGLYKATAGKIVLDGTDITNMPPHQRTAAGLGPHVPEHPPVPFDDGAGECRDRRRAAGQHHDRQGAAAATPR